VPLARGLAWPLVLIVATLRLEELHVTELVAFWEVPSL